MRFRFFILISFLFSITSVFGQIKNPVRFNLKINSLSNGEYEAVLAASIEPGWHIYSKDLPADSGIPTEMKLSGTNIIPVGKFYEKGNKKSEFSEAFGAQLVYYSGSASFVQKFKLKNPGQAAKVSAEITYQSCDDKVCLAPNTLEFEKDIAGSTAPILPQKADKIGQSDSIIPNETSIAEPTTVALPNISTVSTPEVSKELRRAAIQAKSPLTTCGQVAQKMEENYWEYLPLGFLGGLIALLTPCVYPMIPLTVSYFTKGVGARKGKRDAILYGLFILVIFVLLSVPFHIIDGIAGNIFNEISTNVWLNIAFFIVFLYFAGSFFGYYDISLPSSFANKSAKAEDTGGLIGVFFMALTLVIVSFSCTGPILGSLLGSAVSGSSNVPLLLTMALGGFGLAWALVFGLLALFPQTLKSLPKSGGWMNTLKVVLGFLELGLALKFLSKADLVSKTFLLKRELFLVIWILISITMVAYIFGLIRFPHDDKGNKISPVRKAFGALGLLWIVYLVQGLFPSERPKLQALSGILPPINISYFKKESDGVLGFATPHDYFEALVLAKKENKPILIDFTGYGCENCRKMEEFVWQEPDVLPILQNEIILASLYVDDKEALPAAEQTKVDLGDGQLKKIKTIGDKWSMFQQINFNNNSQPHYVLLTPDEKVINYPISGYMAKEEFLNFLRCGIDYYKKSK